MKRNTPANSGSWVAFRLKHPARWLGYALVIVPVFAALLAGVTGCQTEQPRPASNADRPLLRTAQDIADIPADALDAVDLAIENVAY